MNISIVCSSVDHPVYEMLKTWKSRHSVEHAIEIVQKVSMLSGGDLLLLISCSELVKKDVRDRYSSTLVIHASDLPKGRGWSPHVWQVIEGRSTIKVTLLEAEDKVDSGAIWAQREFHLEGHELCNEINDKLFAAERELLDFAVENFYTVSPSPQAEIEPTYYRKRAPEDSRIDPNTTIAEQFDLLRVCDPLRFPAFFDLRGHTYKITIEKVNANGERK